MNARIRLFLLGLLLAIPAAAQVPRTISYQGVLADGAGAFVPDGAYTLTLRLYDTPSAATPLYTEVQTATVVRGLFNVIIGSVSPLPAALRFDRAYFLGVTVGAEPELAPRTPLTAVPYALRAATADVAEDLAPSATGVVRTVNGQSGAVTLQGGGGTTVTNTGSTITISSVGGGGTGIQGVQSTDGTLSVTNPNGPVATLGIATNGVRSQHIADGSIGAADLAPGVLPDVSTLVQRGGAAGGDLSGTYPDPVLAPGAVRSGSLADGAVTGDKVAAGAVVRSLNTLRDSVTLAAGSNVSITRSGNTLTIAASGGGSGGVQSLQTTNQTMDIINASGPVTTVNVAANGIRSSHLADASVTTAKLADGNVTAAKLAPGAIPASLPPSGAAGGDLTGTYPNPGIANSAVKTAAIADGAVTMPKINTLGATSGQVLTYNGTSAAWGNAGVSGSGATNRLAFWTNTGTLSSDPVLKFTPGANPALVFGGAGSAATGQYSVVLGGGNVVNDNYSIAIGAGGLTINGSQSVAIGGNTTISGIRAVSVGFHMTSTHNGVLMLGDNSTTTTLTSTASNQFNARYAGGYRLYSNSTLGTGVTMAAGTSGWTNVCDRNLKEHVRPVDGEAVLAAFRSMPVTEWSYRNADPSIRYVGPMAQDFHRAFGLGGSDSLGINSIIADGVSMAAIQALERRTADLHAALERRDAEVAALHARIERLTRHLAGRDAHIRDGSEATTGTPEPRARAEKSPRTDSTGPMVDGRLSPGW